MDRSNQQQIDFFQIDNATLNVLKNNHKLLAGFIDPVLDEFYDYIITYPHLAEKFPADTSGVKNKQKQYWLRLFKGEFEPAWKSKRPYHALRMCTCKIFSTQALSCRHSG